MSKLSFFDGRIQTDGMRPGYAFVAGFGKVVVELERAKPKYDEIGRAEQTRIHVDFKEPVVHRD